MAKRFWTLIIIFKKIQVFWIQILNIFLYLLKYRALILKKILKYQSKKSHENRTLLNVLLPCRASLQHDEEIPVVMGTNMTIISITCVTFCSLFQKNDQTYLYPDSIVWGPLYHLHCHVHHAGCRLFICRDVLQFIPGKLTFGQLSIQYNQCLF